jgi:ribosomal protein S18 acetylase RimI-like enzyme
VLVIREFEPARDLLALLELWRQAGPGIHLGASDTPAELQKKRARDPDLFLVAEADGQLAGAVIGGWDGRRGMVYHLAVLPDWRRQGLGSALMAELEDRLRAKGCLKYQLFVAVDNADVIPFYLALGWELRSDLIVMSKVIR